MPVPYAFLETARINGMMAALQDVRQMPQDLLFLNRTPMTPAVDGEVMARFTGYVTVADIIADDQKAAVYNNAKMTIESNAIPNIKHGSVITQEMLNMLRSISSNGGIQNDQVGFFTNYERRTLDSLLLGIRQRMEAMVVAMWLDSFSYNRLGINITNATWGMPSDLKVTVGVTWDTAGTADGLNDILTQQSYARTRFGINYNRVTMSTQALRYLVAQTKTQQKLQMLLAPNVAVAALPFQNVGYMRNLLSNWLDMEIELYDARYWQMASDGSITSTPYLPITKVLLSDSGNDNNASIMDFANAITTESVVADMMPGGFGGFGGPQVGPVSYVTGNPDMNPPNLTYWGVARGFPRKKMLQATSVLSVGAFSDTIPVGPPF